ncbi:MAG TPA: hypothetical protein VG276_04275 [Actinomycetes bacterium]|jgi:hypothetical protein|nr:hypothetical protein [Actinomycetes bacterium]
MRATRGRAAVLLAASAWTLWVWTTRIWNIASDPAHSLGFKLVHTALALVSVAFAVALGIIGLRMRREARSWPGAREPRSPGAREPRSSPEAREARSPGAREAPLA